MDVTDYSEWIIEDLKSQYKKTIKDRDTAELFSDRADLNKQALLIMGPGYMPNATQLILTA